MFRHGRAYMRGPQELAEQLVDDLCRLDAQLRDLHKRLAAMVAALQTSTTDIFGVGPVVEAIDRARSAAAANRIRLNADQSP
jgi:hypothetical protein